MTSKRAQNRQERQARQERLLPGGIPRYVHIYDNGGETIDRYTVVFTGNYTSQTGGQHWYVGMSSLPYHPQGFCQHEESSQPIDYPSYGHLGKKIKFQDLPEDCRDRVLEDYCYLWSLTHPESS